MIAPEIGFGLMTELTKLFTNIGIGDPAVWLAIGSGLAIVLVFLFLGRRQRRLVAVVGPNAEGTANQTNVGPNAADDWMPPQIHADERRRSIRRSGVPTSVTVVDPKKGRKTVEVFVLDRSSGGVRLASQGPFPTGSTLQIRTTTAPPESPWVVIIVRSCREVGDYFELGCQFEEELPWHLLLMFG